MIDRPTPPRCDPAFAQRVFKYLEKCHSEQDLAQLKQDLLADPAKRDQFVALSITRQSLVQWLKERAQYRREMQFDRQIGPPLSIEQDLDQAMILPALHGASVDEAANDHLERFDPAPHLPTLPPNSGGRWLQRGAIAASILIVTLISMIGLPRVGSRSNPVAVVQESSRVVAVPLPSGEPTGGPTRTDVGVRQTSPSTASVGICLDALWDGDASIVRDGELSAGTHSLDRGVAQLNLGGGASVVLQAPSRFQVQDGHRIQLLRGQLSASCPHDSAGLTVQTPDMDAIDIGTEFGVSVTASRQTRLEVFKGAVRAAPLGMLSSNAIVQADHAVLVKSGSNQVDGDIPTPLAYVRYQELADRAATGGNAGFNRWRAFSQTLRDDPDLVAYYTFEKDENQPTKLANESLRTLSQHDGVLGIVGVEGSGPQWSSGRWPQKGALQFGEQTNNVVRIPNGAELTPLPPFTYMMWIKRWDVRRPVHILSAAAGNVRCLDLTLIGADGEKSPFREVNSVYFDMGPSKSAQQSRRQGVYKVLGTDFKWSLVALTMGSDNNAQVYIDGQRVGEFPVMIPQLSRTGELWLGQPDLAAKDLGKSLVYHGWIDEFAIFHRCLSDAELQRIYEAGVP